MGWSSGSETAGKLIASIKRNCEPGAKYKSKIYRDLISAFEHADCDTLYECMGEDQDFDDVFSRMHPPEEQDE